MGQDVAEQGVTRQPEGPPVRRLLSWLLLAVAVACWLIYPFVLWWLDRHALGVAPEAYSTLSNILLNALPGWLFALLLVAFSRRFIFPILLVACVQGLISLASMMKLSILGSPFALQDFYFLRNVNKASLELFGAYVEQPGLLLAGVGGALLGLTMAFWIESPRFRRFGRVQWSMLAVTIVAVGSLQAAAWPWMAIYTKEHVRPSRLSQVPAVLRSGLFASLVHKHLQVGNMRFDVDAAALADVLALSRQGPGALSSPVARERAAPDIILILSESFIDPFIVNRMAELPDSIPVTRRYLEAGRGGRLNVPTYGGGTVRTEFEVLTGMPVDAFPDAYFPYVDLDVGVMPGLPSHLKQLGYRTHAIHGNSGAFWNRTNTYASMGFDKFVTAKEFAARKRLRDGTWYSDEAMTDAILDELGDADSPAFIMAVSIQNHGPYTRTQETLDVRDPTRWQAIQLPEGLQGPAAVELRNYLYNLQSADMQLQRLLQLLDQRGRPYVLAFFGDHLPALASTYAHLGFVDGRKAEQQYTPWLIVSKEGVGVAGDQRVMSAWQLPSEILASAGLAEGEYFDLVGSLGRRLETEGDPQVQARLRMGLLAAANARIKGKKLEGYANAR